MVRSVGSVIFKKRYFPIAASELILLDADIGLKNRICTILFLKTRHARASTLPYAYMALLRDGPFDKSSRAAVKASHWHFRQGRQGDQTLLGDRTFPTYRTFIRIYLKRLDVNRWLITKFCCFFIPHKTNGQLFYVIFTFIYNHNIKLARKSLCFFFYLNLSIPGQKWIVVYRKLK